MQYSTVVSITILVALMVAVVPSHQKTECETKREAAERLVKEQDRPGGSNLAIVIPTCDENGDYARLQCHYKSQFCQCWDKDGSPLTQPKKNLAKCSCLVDRAKQLRTVPPSQTELPEMTSCEVDGSYTPKQCDRTSCWCVNKETGKKLGSTTGSRSSLKC